MKVIGIIPARYASSRFPAKPLADLKGKPMIQHVYERVSKSNLDKVWVATDHVEIRRVVEGFGGNVLMTDENCQNGTERCWNAIQRYSLEADFVINIQGDEPLIHIEPIHTLIKALDETTEICTLVKKIEMHEELFNSNVVKCVKNLNHDAIYFSRAAIPYLRGIETQHWTLHNLHYKHIGIYAYKVKILEKIVQLTAGIWEEAEKLEQLRWLENGFHIKAYETTYQSIGVDTPEDIEKVLKYL